MCDEYELALGRLYERLKDDLPHRERAQGYVPRDVFASLAVDNLVFDRFVREPTADQKLSYPLMQYGPGVASYNVDKTTYDWAAVRASVLDLFHELCATHDDLPSRISTISLRAIDFFRTDDPGAFLRTKLRVEIRTDLARLEQLAGAREAPRFQNTWTLDDEQTELRVAIRPGSVRDQNGLILDIGAYSSGAILGDRGIEALVDTQHALTGDTFFALLTEELHDELGRETRV